MGLLVMIVIMVIGAYLLKEGVQYVRNFVMVLYAFISMASRFYYS